MNWRAVGDSGVLEWQAASAHKDFATIAAFYVNSYPVLAAVIVCLADSILNGTAPAAGCSPQTNRMSAIRLTCSSCDCPLDPLTGETP